MNNLVIVRVYNYPAIVIARVSSNALALRTYLPPGLTGIIRAIDFSPDHAF